MALYNCNICDSIIESKSVRKFCSLSCFGKHLSNKQTGVKKKKLIYLNCLYCKDRFVKKGPKIYCSLKCSTLQKQRKLIESKSYSHKTARSWLMKLFSACAICQNTEWNNQQIPLELDHIDGNPYNHDFKNLRLLCPNCHAQQPNSKGKNRGNGRHYRRTRYAQGLSY